MTLAQPGTQITSVQFFALPDDGKRYELIDGELREMPTPTIRLQRLMWNLLQLLAPEVKRIGGELFPGVGVVVSGNRVQVPDIAVLVSPSLQSDMDYGLREPPDLVIEILSPSTARRDKSEKAECYAAAGVRELWIVSPQAETIEVLVVRNGQYVLHTRVGLNEAISSTVLSGLSFPASAVFAR